MIVQLTENELISLVKKIIVEVENTNNLPDTKFGFGLIFAFPDYEIKGYGNENLTKKVSRFIHGGSQKGTYGKLGHGGIILVDSFGKAYLFEFGRYNTPEGFGRVIQKNLGRIGKIGTQSGIFSSKPILLNAEEVAKIAKRYTEGVGPNLKMNVASVRIPNFQGAYDFAKNKGDLRKYVEIDVIEGGGSNCGTYANDVMNAGGITNISPLCNPYANMIVKSFYPISDKYFSV
jgi:hypothetical protein